MGGEGQAAPSANLLPADVSYDEKKMLLHKLDRWGRKKGFRIEERVGRR